MSEVVETGATAKKAFFAAMAKAQGEIEGAIKGRENPHFRQKYADLGSVWDACRAQLSKNGLAVLQFPDVVTGEKGTHVRVRTIITHSDGHSEQFDLPMPVTKADAQGIGSAITYARRYALMAAVGIAPEDDDGNAAVEKSQSAANGNATISLPKGKSRELYSELQQDVAAADSVDALEAWYARRKDDVGTLPEDWRNNLRSQYASKLHDLKTGALNAAE